MPTTRQIVLVSTALLLFAAQSHADEIQSTDCTPEQVCPAEIRDIYLEYGSTNIRFELEVQGKPFRGVMPFRWLRQQVFDSQQYTVSFGREVGTWAGCELSRESDWELLKQIAYWEEWDFVYVFGQVKSVNILLGGIKLSNCEIELVKD